MKNVYVNTVDLSINREGQYYQQNYINNLVIDANNRHYLFQENTYFILNRELGRRIEIMIIMMALKGSDDYQSVVEGSVGWDRKNTKREE